MKELIPVIVSGLLGPLMVGVTLWFLGKRDISQRQKAEAIRDLMTYRGDYASSDFRRALNKVSITFHDDDEIRLEVRRLYEAINNPSLPAATVKRTIVGLIYKLCRKHGFRGLTEYDIDQAFPESNQAPSLAAGDDEPKPPATTDSEEPPKKKAPRRKKELGTDEA